MLDNDLSLICTLREITAVIDLTRFDFGTRVHVEQIAGQWRFVQVILQDYRIAFNCTQPLCSRTREISNISQFNFA